jgi:hypothetical protein
VPHRVWELIVFFFARTNTDQDVFLIVFVG